MIGARYEKIKNVAFEEASTWESVPAIAVIRENLSE